MSTVLSDRCPKCGNIIPYTEQAVELICPYCSHSFLVVEFVSERLKMNQAQAESAKAQENLATAKAEKDALQARLNDTLSALNAIESTQNAEDVKLDGILAA